MTTHVRTANEAAIREAADRLTAALATHRPCSPIRDLLGETDVAAAYAVQRELTRRRLAGGASVVGRKIGLTSPAVQRQLGVNQPDFGVLFADMDVTAFTEVPSARLLQPKAEAEIAFVLGADLIEGDLDVEQVRGSVAYAMAALEIVDSRVENWDIRITDTVADNASSGLFVLGGLRRTLDDFEPREATMQLYVNGEPASRGNGEACLGDPLIALSWLARTAREFGDPLLAGQVVLSGALGAMVPAPPGTTIQAEISSLGEVSATFSAAREG